MKHRPLLIALLIASCSIAHADPVPPSPVVANPLAIPATDDGLPGSGPIRRADWFQKVWNERRAEFTRRAHDENGAVVFLGDSITHGWNDVASSFPGIKVANRGIGGDTSRGVLIRLHDDVIALHPRAVVLLIGTNDIDEQAPSDLIAGNVKLIVKALHEAQPTMPVVLCLVMPSAEVKNRPMAKIRELNDRYLETFKDQPEVTILDTWSLFGDVHGDARPDVFPDLLHPNIVGYDLWARALRPVFETIGLVPAWPDDFVPELGFTSLFNGRDLSGWRYTDATSLDKAAATSDGRYVAKNQRIVVTISRKGSSPTQLATVRKFSTDFVLRLEFRASPNADSGVFIRGTQLQCRDYGVAGPFATAKSYRPLDWNELEITVRGGLAHCTCNGEVIMDAMPVGSTGPIGLESDRGQVEYRRLRIRELQ